MKRLAALLLPLLAACDGESPAVEMRFVDEIDKNPVADVKVTFCGAGWEGTLTGHGGRSRNLFRIEGQTDASGAIQLASRKFDRQPFGASTNYDQAVMVIDKAGYMPYKIINTGRTLGTYEAVSSWAYDKATIALKRSASAAAEETLRKTIYRGACDP